MRISCYFLTACFLLLMLVPAMAQRIIVDIQKQPNINFTQLSDNEINAPLPTIEKDAEEDENIKAPFAPHTNKRIGDAFAFTPNGASYLTTVPSPKPTQTFAGPTDNGWVPPDVNGAVGLNHLVTTLNGVVTIQNKTTGGTVSSVNLNSFFINLYSNYVFDPRVSYDPIDNRFIILACTDAWASSSSLVVAVSETGDPTGNWYRYVIKGDTKNDGVWLDYPTLGFNSRWVTATGNMFTNGGYFAYSQIFVLDKSWLYQGLSGSIQTFTDVEPFTLQPCVTYDKAEPNQYLIADWTGNENGRGALKVYKIAPNTQGLADYAVVGLAAVNETWRYSGALAPQLGDERKIATNDSRLLNAVFKNGSIWTTHTVFLPEAAPTHSGIDWWQISPSANVIQFGRIEDATTKQFYAYPSIAVNDCNDVMIGFNQFSTTIYPSAAYAFRNGTDPLSTIGTSTVFKAGLAPYYKTFGTSRNRWGDYSATCVDPSDGKTFWTLQEYANTPRDRWATWWGKLQGKTLDISLNTYTAPAVTSSAILNLTTNGTWKAQANVDWLTVTPSSGAVNTAVRFNCTANTTGSARTAMVTFTNGCVNETMNITQKAVCEKVTSLAISNITPFMATVSWVAAIGASSYIVEWKKLADIVWLSKVVTTPSTVLDNLTDITNYQVRVTTQCPLNDVTISTVINFTTLPTACLPTAAPTITSVQSNAATVNWLGTDNAVNYQIMYRKKGITTWSAVTVVANPTSKILTALTPNTEYEVQILKICSNSPRRVSLLSDITTFKTLPFCATPTGILSSEITFNKASIKWTAVAGTVQSYAFEYKKTTDTEWSSLSTTVPSLILNNLTPATTYQMRVRTVCTTTPLSESTVSPIYSFRTLTFVCAAPVTPSVSDVFPNSCTVSWKAATNATRYRLEYKKTTESVWQTAYEGTNLTYTLTSLTENTVYNLRLTTICNAPPEVNSTAFALNVVTPLRNCTDVYETNNTRALARVIALNTLIRAKISTATDEDWFRISTTASCNLEITLRDLVANYNLYLYDATGNLLVSSTQNSTTDETLVLTTPSVSTIFYIQVKSTTGVFHTDCYALKATVKATTNMINAHLNNGNTPLSSLYYMTLSPNPTSGIVRIEIGSPETQIARMTVTDYLGRVVFDNKALVLQKGIQIQEVNLSDFSNGVYIVRLASGDFQVTQKVLVNR